jgi:hypothetical protein
MGNWRKCKLHVEKGTFSNWKPNVKVKSCPPGTATLPNCDGCDLQNTELEDLLA